MRFALVCLLALFAACEGQGFDNTVVVVESNAHGHLMDAIVDNVVVDNVAEAL